MHKANAESRERLRELGVAGVLSFQLAKTAEAAPLEVTYRASGDATHGLDKLAAIVDTVIGEQVARLISYVETGKAKP